jgi:hypothetical protein
MASLPNFRVPAPNLPPGTYNGAYAAQGLRTSNPYQAAQLWENRHPAATQDGNTPDWVTQALVKALGGAGTPNGASLINPNMLLLHLLGNQPQPPAPPNAAPAASGIDAATGAAAQVPHSFGPQDNVEQAAQNVDPAQAAADQANVLAAGNRIHPGAGGPIHPADLHKLMMQLSQGVSRRRVTGLAGRLNAASNTFRAQ